MKQSLRTSAIALLLLAEFLGAPLAGGVIAKQNFSSRGQVIFQQPVLGGIAGNFFVPSAEHKYPYLPAFKIVLWQPNPTRPDGELVPSSWGAGNLTGFYPSQPIEKHQAAFRDASGSSTVQIEGSSVGAYITSSDLSRGPANNKMMITPTYDVPKGEEIYPFATQNIAIANSFDLQVPVADDQNRPGNYTYVSAIFLFVDRKSHTLISYSVPVFHHSLSPAPFPDDSRLQQTAVGPYDPESHSFQVGNPLVPNSQLVTPLDNSALYDTQPWRNWRKFSFAITSDNFKSALLALKSKSSFPGSDDPADYAISQWHLNAELQYGTGPARIGWSFRGAQIALRAMQ